MRNNTLSCCKELIINTNKSINVFTGISRKNVKRSEQLLGRFLGKPRCNRTVISLLSIPHFSPFPSPLSLRSSSPSLSCSPPSSSLVPLSPFISPSFPFPLFLSPPLPLSFLSPLPNSSPSLPLLPPFLSLLPFLSLSPTSFPDFITENTSKILTEEKKARTSKKPSKQAPLLSKHIANVSSSQEMAR